MPGLKRTKTIRPKSGVSSSTAARTLSTSTRQRSQSAATKALKRTASVRESLVISTAVGKAENAIFRAKEEKYFHVGADATIAPQKPTGNANTTTSVLAFSTTDNTIANGTGSMGYCGHTVQNLNMLRVYQANEGDAKLRPYSLTGKKATPTVAQIQWTVNRNYVRNGMNRIDSRVIGSNDFPPGDDVNDAQLYQNLPIRCRMIRVTPKLAPGVTLGVDPTTDLFLDQRGLKYSPNDTEWTASDNEYARVNTRNYTVLADGKFTLGQPLTAVWKSQYTSDPASGQQLWHQDITYPNKACLKRTTTRHQLTAKKGGEVHYVAGSDGTVAEAALPTSGQRREYVIMHFWYECGDGNAAIANLPPLIGAGVAPVADALKIHFRVESRFKEQ